MKITYKTNVLDVIRLVENNTPALWKKEWNNFVLCLKAENHGNKV